MWSSWMIRTIIKEFPPSTSLMFLQKRVVVARVKLFINDVDEFIRRPWKLYHCISLYCTYCLWQVVSFSANGLSFRAVENALKLANKRATHLVSRMAVQCSCERYRRPTSQYFHFGSIRRVMQLCSSEMLNAKSGVVDNVICSWWTPRMGWCSIMCDPNRWNIAAKFICPSVDHRTNKIEEAMGFWDRQSIGASQRDTWSI